MDDNGMLEKPFATKTRKLTISNISKAIQSSSIWKGRNEKALEAIDIHRRIRNLVAHFAVRRFPTEDAYIFMTKSSADFKQVFGALPASDALLYGVTESAQMAGLIPVLEGLVSWSSKVANDLSSPTEMPPRTEMI
jgi:hypothetical protein